MCSTLTPDQRPNYTNLPLFGGMYCILCVIIVLELFQCYIQPHMSLSVTNPSMDLSSCIQWTDNSQLITPVFKISSSFFSLCGSDQALFVHILVWSSCSFSWKRCSGIYCIRSILLAFNGGQNVIAIIPDCDLSFSFVGLSCDSG